MPEHTFLSYSRHEYYFAESVALSLQHRGLSIWFDLQQIEPGTNWKADIDDGLARCQSLTLVASRAALASPYVEQEWRAVLEANKPVYVVLFEWVRLPRILRRRATILDFRGDFERGIDELAALLTGETLPKRRVWTWSLRLPRGVRRMALALMLLDAQILAANVLTLVLLVMTLYPGSIVRLLAEQILGRAFDVSLWIDGLIAVVVIFAVIRYLLHIREYAQVFFFLLRDLDYAALVKSLAFRVSVRFDMILLAILGVSVYLASEPQFLRQIGVPPAPSYNPVVLAGLLAAVGVIRVVMPWLIRRTVPRDPDPDIVRWARLGMVPQHMRLAVNRHLLSAANASLPSDETVRRTSATGSAPPVAGTVSLSATVVDTPSSFRLVHSDGDEKAAQRIAGIMRQIGYTQAEDAVYTLLVLSYRTPVDLVRECLHLSANVISVMVTDIHLPPDVSAVTDAQLIDARRSNWPQVQAALRFLTSQEEAARARYSQSVLPVSLAPLYEDAEVGKLVERLRLLVGTILVFVLWFFLRMVWLAIPVQPIPVAFAPLVTACLALLLAAIVLLWCVTGARCGRLRLPVVVTEGLLVFPAVVMLGFVLSDRLNGAFTLLGMPGQVDARQSLVVIGFYGAVALGVVWWLASQRTLLVTPRAAVLGMPPVAPGWSSVAGALLVLMLVMALMAVNIL